MTTDTKSNGIFAEMQIISYSFYNPKAHSDEFTNLKTIDAESPIFPPFFLGGGGGEGGQMV